MVSKRNFLLHIESNLSVSLTDQLEILNPTTLNNIVFNAYLSSGEMHARGISQFVSAIVLKYSLSPEASVLRPVIPLNSLSALSFVHFFAFELYLSHLLIKTEIVYKISKAKIHRDSNLYDISKHLRYSLDNQANFLYPGIQEPSIIISRMRSLTSFRAPARTENHRSVIDRWMPKHQWP